MPAPTAKPTPNGPCPCDSGAKYKRCCRSVHGGDPAKTPESLMRSRFSAFALGLIDHIIATTDPVGPLARRDRMAWQAELREFCEGTEFQGLEVLGGGEESGGGWVRFRAILQQGAQDASFVERSHFVQRDGRWLYHSGQVEGR